MGANTMIEQTEKNPKLQQKLKTRHVTMISLGSIIGAGLFVGSSAVISLAGPSAFVAYAFTGVLVMLIMRMVGEMAAAHPVSGSFVEYARMAFGNWAGFSTGWLYWYFWVIVVGFEAVVGGQIINGWFPDFPVWSIALVLLIVMTAINLLSVGSFGEAEYWFSGLKIIAIVVFIAVAAAYAFGPWPGSSASISNLFNHGGFFPHGIVAFLSSIVVIIFSMTGVEVIAIAAAESADPERSMQQAVKSVIIRVLAFFVISTFLIVVIQPWTEVVPGKSPFVTTFDTIGIPGASTMLTIVILVAILSVINAGLYTASRLLFVLSLRGEAPKTLTHVSARGVPIKGVLFSTLIGYACVIIAALWPDTVFLFLINSSGAVFLFIYLMICLSQMKLRKRWVAEGTLKFRMWGHPWLPLAVTACIIAVIVSMLFEDSTRISLMQCLISVAFILIVFVIMNKFKQNRFNISTSQNAVSETE